LNKVKCGILNIFSWWFKKNKFEYFWTRNEENFQNISKYFWPKITKPCHMIFQRAYKKYVVTTRKVEVAILKSNRWFETNNEKNFEQKIRDFFIMFGTFFKKFSEFVEFDKLNSNSKFSKKAIIRKFCTYKSCLDYETLNWWYIQGEYINPVKSFLSRAHISICQNAPTPWRDI
jgi:hypothetical protein